MSNHPLIRVVDDDDKVRESLQQLIHAMGYSVTCYESAEAYLKDYESTTPGCIILDVKMPGMSGIELQEYLSERKEELPVILISGHGDIPMCVQAMKMGAVDFLEKPYRVRALEECVRKGVNIDAERRAQAAARAEMNNKLEKLTNQERSVLEGIASGKQTKQIASELDVSLRTVQFRRASLMEKLQVDSRAELVKLMTLIADEQQQQVG